TGRGRDHLWPLLVVQHQWGYLVRGRMLNDDPTQRPPAARKQIRMGQPLFIQAFERRNPCNKQSYSWPHCLSCALSRNWPEAFAAFTSRKPTRRSSTRRRKSFWSGKTIRPSSPWSTTSREIQKSLR